MNKQIDEMARDICRLGKPCEKCSAYPDACNAVKYAERFYTAGYRKQEWISVEERLPDQEGKYLAYYGRRGFIMLSYYHVLEGVFGFEHWDVTHWMPLPMPPKTN